MWETCVGQPNNNYYAAVSVWNNKVYILYNTTTSEFATDTVDIALTVLDLRTGMEMYTKIYGSTEDDTPIDMVINHFGIFMIADIGNGFKDRDTSDDYLTQNSNINFAIILMDYDGNIQEIESYDTSDVSNDINGDYPLKLFIGRQNKHEPLYWFLSYRSYAEYYLKGGVYLTQVDDQQALFVSGSSLAA